MLLTASGEWLTLESLLCKDIEFDDTSDGNVSERSLADIEGSKAFLMGEISEFVLVWGGELRGLALWERPIGGLTVVFL